MLDLLARQVASPVQFLKGLRTLYDEGARVFVEVGPKRALQGFASDVLGDDAVLSLATNHPKQGDVATFNSALCGLWAAGLGAGREPSRARLHSCGGAPPPNHGLAARRSSGRDGAGEGGRPVGAPVRRVPGARPRADGAGRRGRRPTREPVVITGAALGLPGAESAVRRRERGADAGRRAGHRRDSRPPAPGDPRQAHHAAGQGRGRRRTFETIDRLEDVIKLAARAGAFDLDGGVRDRRRPRCRARARHAAGDRRGHRRAARRGDPARARATRPRLRAPNFPRAGRCPTRCATTPG